MQSDEPNMLQLHLNFLEISAFNDYRRYVIRGLCVKIQCNKQLTELKD